MLVYVSKSDIVVHCAVPSDAKAKQQRITCLPCPETVESGLDSPWGFQTLL